MSIREKGSDVVTPGPIKSVNLSSVAIRDGWIQYTKSYYIIGIVEEWRDDANVKEKGHTPRCFVAAIPKDATVGIPVNLSRKYLKSFTSTNWSPDCEPFPKLVEILTGGESTSGGYPPARRVRWTNNFKYETQPQLISDKTLDESFLYQLTE